MFCTNCGTKIADGSKFCGSCGTNVDFDFESQQQNMNIAPAANAQQTNVRKKMAQFTSDEAMVCGYIGSSSKNAFRFGSLGRNDGISLLNWIEQYSDSSNCQGVHLFLYPPDKNNLCKLFAIVEGNDGEDTATRDYGMDYNDDMPIKILFGTDDTDRTEFDGHDCMHRFVPFV